MRSTSWAEGGGARVRCCAPEGTPSTIIMASSQVIGFLSCI
jgi:hypothetical protein